MQISYNIKQIINILLIHYCLFIGCPSRIPHGHGNLYFRKGCFRSHIIYYIIFPIYLCTDLRMTEDAIVDEGQLEYILKQRDELKAENEALKKWLEKACILLAINLGNIDDVDSYSIAVDITKINKDANSWLEWIRSEEE